MIEIYLRLAVIGLALVFYARACATGHGIASSGLPILN